MSFRLTEKMRFLRQASYMNRFHTLPGHHQNIGHHSWNVALIIQQFWPKCRKEVILAAMYHDVPELITGDIPAPFKWQTPALCSILDDFEEKVLRDYGWHQELTDSEKRMLGIADTLDLVLYAQEQMEMGNGTFMLIFSRGIHHLMMKYQGTDEIRPLTEVIEGLSEALGGVPKHEQN